MKINKTSTQLQQEQRKKGFTLTEIAIVLGIMGLILGGIWVAAAGVYNSQRVNQANTAIMQVLQSVRTLYAQQATMPAADQTANLINAGVIPTNLISGATLRTPWGGTMFVTGTADTIGVAIVLNGMSTAVCVGVVSTVAGISHDRTLSGNSLIANAAGTVAQAIALNTGALLTSAPAPTTGAAGALTAAPANTNCTASSTTNSAIFVFGLQG